MPKIQVLEKYAPGFSNKENTKHETRVFRGKVGKIHEVPRRTALQPLQNKITHNAKRAKICIINEDKGKVENKGNNLAIVKNKVQRLDDKKGVENKEKTLKCLKQSEKVVEVAIKPKPRESDEYHLEEEYLQEIWSYMMSLEKKVVWPKPSYMSKQTHLNFEMRNVLIDWLVAVSEEYKLSEHTIHLSVNYIDRFLSQMSVIREKFQLLGSAAMMLAAKVEEIYPPDAKEWSYLTGSTYTSQQIQRMEQLLLKVLNFDLQPPTILAFLQQFCYEHRIDKKTMYLAMYISELMLLEGAEYLKHMPSKLAAAALALSRMTLSKKEAWPKNFEEASGYSLKQLSPVVKKQNITFKDSPTTPQQAIQTKYKNSKFLKVSLLKPKVLNLDQPDED